ncbi:MAG: cbb3-type cytochrome c oxidase subunit I [Armatimonadetes bacterium]|nr:cytochrome c oxidase subunit I [Armatimonadota bacterium]MBS1702289.1 cbb3-type cytochrome c oxidase subunit I [Armatimonadota bacterium]MBS1727123.1 cbb3-type cytochrome c oxidase subunit I [Armatimonadota bacterium]
MSTTVTTPIGNVEPAPKPRTNYLTNGHTLRSWLLTEDHKRIAILYLISVSFFFMLGGSFAGMIRWELTSPAGNILESDAYNRVFTAHGAIMVFLFLLVAVPAVLGNFCLPLMIGAKDLAFPRINLLSWYLYTAAGTLVLISVISGGVDAGWTFYTPYSSLYSNSNVSLCLVGVFIGGFSSITTGVNFIATVHRMRAPGMTWFRMPLFVWAHYATGIIMMLGTPVVAITLLCVIFERTFQLPIFSPELGGDPVLFQHMFWFYSHPAVYIMVLPSFGVISEVITAFSRKRVFGYHFIAFSSLAIAFLGFLVWGHHMFVSSQSMYQGVAFSLITFLLAVPSAIKVFNWTATMWKGNIHLNSPMIYAIGFMGLFLIGGLTGLFLACMGTDVHLTATYFIVAHFHYVMVGGTVMGFLAGLHFWWPKMTGKLFNDNVARWNAIVVFLGFNLTFFPQFILGWLGMPRRYHYYYFAPEYQPFNIMSTLGATVLGVGFIVPVFYLITSLFKGKPAGDNPWGAHGLEWQTTSPPPTENFYYDPIVTDDVYDYDPVAEHEQFLEKQRQLGAHA